MKILKENQEQYIGDVALLDAEVRLAVVRRPANEQSIWSRFLMGNTIATQGHYGIWYLPVLIPERVIELHDADGLQGRLRFSEQAIRQMAHTFKSGPLLLGHGGAEIVGSSVVETWLTAGRLIDKATKVGFPAVPKGTWMVGVCLPEGALPQTWETWGISLQAAFKTSTLKTSDGTTTLQSENPIEKDLAIPLEAEFPLTDPEELAWADEVARRLAHYQNGNGWASL